MSTHDLIPVPTFPFPNIVGVVVREKGWHQLLASGDDSIGVGNSIVSMLGLAVGADMILRVNSILTISGSKTS